MNKTRMNYLGICLENSCFCWYGAHAHSKVKITGIITPRQQECKGPKEVRSSILNARQLGVTGVSGERFGSLIEGGCMVTLTAYYGGANAEKQ